MKNTFAEKICGQYRSESLLINGASQLMFMEVSKEGNVKYNFDCAIFSYTATYVEHTSHSLYFCHNDDDHKTEYMITNAGDNVLHCKFKTKNCWGLTGEYETEFTLVPLTPEDIEKYGPIVEPKSLGKVDLLKEYPNYGTDPAHFTFQFLNDERENVQDIIAAHKLDPLMAGKTDSQAAIALMGWLCQHYKHGNPPTGLPSIRTPQALMAAADSWENRTNCRGLSLILAQLLRAYGLPAYHVTCLPYEEPFSDCHVVVDVYCKDLGKTIMLDPTSNLYIYNSQGAILSIAEFRDALLADETLTFNPDYFAHHWDVPGYSDYMAKNLIRIERYTLSGYGIDGGKGYTVLVPQKYMDNEAKNFAPAEQDCFTTNQQAFWQIERK